MAAVYENKTVCFLFINIVHLLNNFTKKFSEVSLSLTNKGLQTNKSAHLKKIITLK